MLSHSSLIIIHYWDLSYLIPVCVSEREREREREREYVFVIVAAVVVYYASRVAWSLWLKPRMLERKLRQQGIEGNAYRFLYGDIMEDLQLIKGARSSPMDLNHQIVPRVAPFVHQMVQKYGNTCFLWMGATLRLIICDQHMVREVYMDRSGHFQKSPVNPLIKRLLSRGVSSLEGEEWAHRRRIISPAFHLEKLKIMMPSFTKSCIDLIKRWEKSVSREGSCELDVWIEFQNLTSDVISRTAFGSTYEEGKRIFELQKELAVLVIEAARALYFPGFRFLPTAKNNRRMHVDKEIKTMLREMIDKKLNSMNRGESGNDDLLGLLLQSVNLRDQDKHGITIEDVIEECKLFYFAGQETTSSWLTWTFVLLAMHPIWQRRARDEILQRCGKNTPDFESLGQLKIATMILYEVLRLYPPVTSLFRHTQKPTKLRDISLPVGIEILLPTILIHHDPQLWGENAEEFNPDRFSEGISKASLKGQNAFNPFGWGPRICLGQSFAMIEAKMALAIILQHFSFELSPTYAHAPYTVITLQPQHGAHIIIHQL